MTHVRTLLGHSSKVFVALVALALIFSWTTQAQATHEPANKVAASGSETEEMRPNSTVPVLNERIKVSSPRDLVIQVTAECSILNALFTNTETSSAKATGQIRMFLEIDGREVPVSTANTDVGRVVFCNRAYERQMADDEDGDGIDEHSDYIRTRQANAFNWLALNGGTYYDSPANGNNILDVVLYAEFFSSKNCDNPASPLGETCAQGYVGNRTMVIETENASNHEAVDPGEPGATPTPVSSPASCPTAPICVGQD